jgi:hypothetical protein
MSSTVGQVPHHQAQSHFRLSGLETAPHRSLNSALRFRVAVALEKEIGIATEILGRRQRDRIDSVFQQDLSGGRKPGEPMGERSDELPERAGRQGSIDPAVSLRQLRSGPGSKAPTDWSLDGRFVLFRNQRPTRGWDLQALPIGGDRASIPIAETNFDETNGVFSADSKWVAYQSNESGSVEIYVQSFPSLRAKLRVSTSGGTQPRWRRDARELFYVALDGRLMAVPISLVPGRDTIEAGTPVALFSTSIGAMGQGAFRQQYMVSPDGQRFLINTVPEANTPITILLNWRAASLSHGDGR